MELKLNKQGLIFGKIKQRFYIRWDLQKMTDTENMCIWQRMYFFVSWTSCNFWNSTAICNLSCPSLVNQISQRGMAQKIFASRKANMIALCKGCHWRHQYPIQMKLTNITWGKEDGRKVSNGCRTLIIVSCPQKQMKQTRTTRVKMAREKHHTITERKWWSIPVNLYKNQASSMLCWRSKTYSVCHNPKQQKL